MWYGDMFSIDNWIEIWQGKATHKAKNWKKICFFFVMEKLFIITNVEKILSAFYIYSNANVNWFISKYVVAILDNDSW
jgi:hypothetical protein